MVILIFASMPVVLLPALTLVAAVAVAAATAAAAAAVVVVVVVVVVVGTGLRRGLGSRRAFFKKKHGVRISHAVLFPKKARR